LDDEKQKLLDLIDTAKRATLRPILEKVQNKQALASHELKLLNEFEAELKAPAAEIQGEQDFKNLNEVAQYLDREGWKVSRSTFYKHAKEGRIKGAADGTYALKAVQKYAAAFLMKRSDHQKMADEELQRKKTKAEIRRIEEQVKREQFKRMVEEGKYIPKDQLYLELAARAAVLDTGIRALIQLRCEEWISAVRGDHELTATLARVMISDFEDLVNAFATTRQFQVMFMEEDHAEPVKASDLG
jgi:hypothetical protein